MADFILIDGDTVNFDGNFTSPVATVVALPGTLHASGKATLGGKKVCVEGDEANVAVPGCPYTTPQCSLPGVGTLKISALAGDQKTEKSKMDGKAMLLKGKGTFTAKFEVQTFAQQPGSPPTPDTNLQYTGTGTFVTANDKYQAD
jgi:hypothetical protein